MPLPAAQEYLAKVLPWPQDGERDAYVNIHWTIDKLHPKSGKPIWTGRACRSVSEAAKTVEWAMRGDARDIYVCMSSQSEALEKVSMKGNNYLLPIRAQQNAVHLKSLFLDLDAKGEDKNSYATVDDAIRALTTFISETKLPSPSAIVTSGGGLHCYWTVATPLTKDEWQPLAYALAEATKLHGLKCDTACTIDAARVLRVPQTFNHKLETPRPVTLAGNRTGPDYSVERLARVLEPYKTPNHPTNVLPPRAPLTGESDLAAGIDMGALKPFDLNAVAVECGFIRDALATNGKNLPNPLWNLTTLISTFCEGGRADAHRLASGHEGYTKESTDELYDRKERERESKGLGWPACRTISASGSGACGSCVHYLAGKSPLNFAAAAAHAVPVTPALLSRVGNVGGGGHIPMPNDLPPGFVRDGKNTVQCVVVGQAGSTSHEPVSSYPMMDPVLQEAPTYTLSFTAVLGNGRKKRIALPTKEASTPDSVRKMLSEQGLMVRSGKEAASTTEFIVSWIKHLQQQKDFIISSAPFGWSVVEDKIEGFVYGGQLWSPTGARRATQADQELAVHYGPTGSREPWIEAAKLITSQGRPALDAVLASSFAAPLIGFTEEPGVLMSTYSQESGIGKTTALKVAQSVWGAPVAMAGLNDTHNSVVKKIGQLRSLPVFWDELKTEEDTKRFVKLVFQLSQQRDKTRLTQSATQQHVGTWNTLLVSASNDSVLDQVMQATKQSLAGLNRVFEYEVPPARNRKGQINQSEASQTLGKLNTNYGHIGLEYAKYLGANHDAIKAEVFAFDKTVGHDFQMENEERFWRAMITSVLMGAQYANDLGFTEIQIESLRAFLYQTLCKLRGERVRHPVDMTKRDNVINVLSQFLGAKRARNTIKTNQIYKGIGKPPVGAVALRCDPSRLDGIHVHIGLDDKVLRISKNELSRWFETEKYSRDIMFKALENTFGAVTTKRCIAAGTDHAVGQEYLLEIELSKHPDANFLDGA